MTRKGADAVKIVIISDVHANYDALVGLPESYDELWVLGDLVDYGPQPSEVVEFIRNNATIVVCGNHDQAVSYNEDPRCTPAYAEMAKTTQEFTISALSDDSKRFLQKLPLNILVDRDGKRFYLCHAMPSDPLYGYCPSDSEQWPREALRVQADAIVVGHTHTPFIRTIDGKAVVNPGSLGQPKTGRTEACYAVWENNSFALKSFRYSLDNTISKIRHMPLPEAVKSDLIAVLRSGGELPQQKIRKAATSATNRAEPRMYSRRRQ
jgi:putative phosphoesterase